MSRVIVITGPTAVGKTKLSIELAKKLNGEIINADAMQVYKGLNIGTAKVTEKEKENIPHHLFDIKEVEEEYSIYNYQKDCRKVIDDILRRNKTPILVGGTGLYIKAALYDYKLSEEKTNNTYDNLKTEEIYKELLKLDKDINIDKNNRRRLIRALNYYKENNTSISNNKTNKLLYDTIFIGLTTDREILYKKINQRVDNMIENGLLEEVKYYYDKNNKITITNYDIISNSYYREVKLSYVSDNYCSSDYKLSDMWVYDYINKSAYLSGDITEKNMTGLVDKIYNSKNVEPVVKNYKNEYSYKVNCENNEEKYTLIFEDFSENELLVKREVNGNTKFAVYEIENVKDYLKSLK